MSIFHEKEKNFTEWFLNVLRKADVIEDRYPLKGLYMLPSYGLSITKNIIGILEDLLRKTGHLEERYPSLIPISIFYKEKDFLEGFMGESYLIDKTLKKEKIEEPLVLRPTSETVIYYLWSLRLRNYKQLPLKIFQTVNIFRCETKMTKPFLRLREVMFFNEAHTAHRTLEDSEKQIKEAINIYKEFFNILSLPYLIIKTPEWDTFPGALYNYDFITVMPDGKALELASVINLGQKFSRAFDIKIHDPQPIMYLGENKFSVLLENEEELLIKIYKDKGVLEINNIRFEDNDIKEIEFSENEKSIKILRKYIEEYLKTKNLKIKPWRYIFQTCYGVSERVVGAYIAIHGDNRGLVLDPMISPIQIVIVPIPYKENKEKILEKANELYELLKEKYRVVIDLSDKTPGEKFYFWEMKGVPVRIEIGPKDLEENKVTIFRRDINIKERIDESKIEEKIEQIFKEFKENLMKKAKEYFNRKLFYINKLEDIDKYKDKGIIIAHICKREDHANLIKEKFQREVLGYIVEGYKKFKGKCIICGKEIEDLAVIGKTY